MKIFKNNLIAALFFSTSLLTFSQVGIGTTDPKAALDVVSTDAGFLMPRVADHTTLSVSADQIGMQVYNTTTKSVWTYSGVVWEKTVSVDDMIAISLWESNTNGGSYDPNDIINFNGVLYKNKTGNNTDTTPAVNTTDWVVLSNNFISDADGDTRIQLDRTLDDDRIRFDLGGTEKFVMRGVTLEPVNNGNSVFFGENAGLNDNLSNNQNVAVGKNALTANVAGEGNVAVGTDALDNLTDGVKNTVIGFNTGQGILTGSENTIVGANVTELDANLTRNIILANGNGNIRLQNDNTRWKTTHELQAGGFDTAWQNATNGGVYDPNDLVIYEGSLYKNITGTNSNTSPNSDAGNWEKITGVSSIEAKSMIDGPLHHWVSTTFDGGWELYFSGKDQMMIRNVTNDITMNGTVGYFKPSNGVINVTSRTMSMTSGTWYTLWLDETLDYTSSGSREWAQFTDGLGREYMFKTTLGNTRVFIEFQRIK